MLLIGVAMVDPTSSSLPVDRTGVSGLRGATRKFSKSSSRIKEEFEHLGVLHRTDFPLNRWQWTRVKIGGKDIYLQKVHLAKRNVFKIGDALYVEDKVLGRGVAKVAKVGKRLVGSGAVKVAITFSLNPGESMPVSDRAIERLLSHHVAREFCSAKQHKVQLIGDRGVSGVLRTSELGIPLDQVLKGDLLSTDKSLIIKRLTAAVDSLRKAGVYHGDLKFDNIIIVPGEEGGDWQLKFIDFDGARTYDETSRYESPSLHISLGIALMDLEHPDPAVLA